MVSFLEKENARKIMGVSEKEFGKLVPHIFHLSFPGAGVQLFPEDYLRGLREHCDEQSGTSIRVVRDYAALQKGPAARSMSHIAQAVQDLERAWQKQPYFTGEQLATVLGVAPSRVAIWVRLKKLIPIHPDDTPGLKGELFSSPYLASVLKWHMPSA